MNNKKPKNNASGYNGSQPLRVYLKCKIEKPLSDFGYRDMFWWKY
ncbi:hypothetical protein [Campylobacter suis]|uniref:Uncharacterized protein n=1 Tax=Campylobacter suis TaxID=2790657 RepID=A0ABN7K1Y7_9BACT|nr:hypothetical protein [Campylobacter suis]CAD7286563.1 hypothetical protein LMG8286_00396 [Campylobacter suis]